MDVYIDCPPQDVFDFCRDGVNFARIFPDPIRPTSDTNDTVIRLGQTYSFRHWMRGILPIRWDVHIPVFVEGEEFVDMQLRGPLRYWRHHHIVEPEGDGTRYRDRIDYATFMGGRLDRTLVRLELERIFTHRHREMKRLLAAGRA